METVLITGATGFIGKHLAERLSRRRGTRLVCLARPRSRQEDVAFLSGLGAEVLHGDLRNPVDAAAAVAGAHRVVHLAAKVYGGEWDERAYSEANVLATQNLLAACRREKMKRFVHVSTVGVYGPASEADESTPLAPVCAYERTKATAESYVRESGLDHVIVRAGSIFGPYDEQFRQSFRIANAGVAPVIAGASAVIQPLYVKDLVAILAKLLGPGIKNETVIAAGKERLTVREFVRQMAPPGKRVRFVSLPKVLCFPLAKVNDRLERLTGRNMVLNLQLYRVFTASRTYDISKLERLLEPQFTPLEKAMAESREWYLS